MAKLSSATLDFLLCLLSYFKHVAWNCCKSPWVNNGRATNKFAATSGSAPGVQSRWSERGSCRLALDLLEKSLDAAANFITIEKDTALAWFIPTKTATHRITLDHSLLNLCGSPRCRSMQGYNNPITAVNDNNKRRKEQLWLLPNLPFAGAP